MAHEVTTAIKFRNALVNGFALEPDVAALSEIEPETGKRVRIETTQWKATRLKLVISTKTEERKQLDAPLKRARANGPRRENASRPKVFSAIGRRPVESDQVRANPQVRHAVLLEWAALDGVLLV